MESWNAQAGVLKRRGRADRNADGSPGAPPDSSARDALVYGEYKPDATTTGVLPGTSLTNYNASSVNELIITTPGTTISNMRIYGDIKIRAANVTIQNCELVGGNNTATGTSGVVDCNSSACFNAVIKDCDIIPRKPSLNRDGIIGHEYTALRCHVRNTIDGFGVYNDPSSGGSQNANVTLKGNYVHDLMYYYPDYKNGVSGVTWHTDGTHNDTCQIQGGGNIYLIGNYMCATSFAGTGSGANPDKPLLIGTGNANGAALVIQKNVGALTNVVIEKNWFEGGLSEVNAKPGAYTLQNNIFSRNVAKYSGWSGYWIRIDSRADTTITGLLTNRWEDTNELMTEPRTSGIHYNA